MMLQRAKLLEDQKAEARSYGWMTSWYWQKFGSDLPLKRMKFGQSILVKIIKIDVGREPLSPIQKFLATLLVHIALSCAIIHLFDV